MGSVVECGFCSLGVGLVGVGDEDGVYLGDGAVVDVVGAGANGFGFGVGV